MFGGFAPNSQTAQELSKALGSRTVMTGSVSRGKNDPSQSLQMTERPLLTPDELKSMPKGEFVVMKTGCHPMRSSLKLFLDLGITFGEAYRVEERSNRKVAYASKEELEAAIRGPVPDGDDDGEFPFDGAIPNPVVKEAMERMRTPPPSRRWSAGRAVGPP